MTTGILNKIKEILKAGETKEKKIGVEFEHFIIDKATMKSIGYSEPGGGLSIAKQLVKKGWHIEYEEKKGIFAIGTEYGDISFEPGGQIEISLPASDSIKDVDQLYQKIICEVEGCLLDGHGLVGLGYHPKSKIDDLPLVEKERYVFMYDYLHEKGKHARNMMKGSASTQVSIDYESEEDFIKKYRVANFLSPVLAYLFDAAPVFEGDVAQGLGVRANIWLNMDPVRSKYPKGILTNKMDYEGYGRYILTVPPVFLPSLGITQDQSLGDLATEYALGDEDVAHGMTMAFPDVRAKSYIEIRMMDAMPYPFNLAIPTLIKHLFYHEDLLDEYYRKSLSKNDQYLNDLDQALVEGKTELLEILAVELLSKVLAVIAGEDRGYLEQFIAFRATHGHYVQYLKSLVGSQEFLTIIEGKYVCSSTMKN